MIPSNPFHKVLEYFMRRTAFMLGIHHIEQPYIILELFDECPPLGFIIDVAVEQLSLNHLTKLHTISTLLHAAVLLLFLQVPFLGLHYVLAESVYAVQIV